MEVYLSQEADYQHFLPDSWRRRSKEDKVDDNGEDDGEVVMDVQRLR